MLDCLVRPSQDRAACLRGTTLQNSALGAFLALAHFPDPLTAVPCAISACTHSLMGSAIAGAWRWGDLMRARTPFPVRHPPWSSDCFSSQAGYLELTIRTGGGTVRTKV